MNTSCLLWPFQYDQDNRLAFSFSRELSRLYGVSLLTVTAVEGHDKFVDEIEFRKYISGEKERVYSHLLKLNNYYQEIFRNDLLDTVTDPRNIIGEKSIYDAIHDLLSTTDITCAVFTQLCFEQYIINRVNDQFSEKEGLKCIVIPTHDSVMMPENKRFPFPERDDDSFLDRIIADCDILELQPTAVSV